jgi:tricorn protease
LQEPRARPKVPAASAGFYADAHWSPDSKRISFTDNALAIWMLDLESGRQTKVTADVVYGPRPVLDHAWSPDSRWLAYTQNTPTLFNRLFLYSLADGKSYPISDGLANATSPVFDGSGQFLYFLVSTDAGPAVDWFSLAGSDVRSVQQIYLAVLAKGVPSPLAKESDEEKPRTDETKEAAEKAKEADAKSEKGRRSRRKPSPSRKWFDPEGVAERILTLPVKAGAYPTWQQGRRTGSITGVRLPDRGADAAVFRYDLRHGSGGPIARRRGRFPALGRRQACRCGSRTRGISSRSATSSIWPSSNSTSNIQVKIDPPTEWAQILDEVWRINRDYFTTPATAPTGRPCGRSMRRSSRPSPRATISAVSSAGCSSELAVGHSYQSPGDNAFEGETIPGGLLGADYEVANGRYRFRKVLAAQLESRSSFAAHGAGVDVRAGEYLLAVNGRDLARRIISTPASNAPPGARWISPSGPIPTAPVRAR